MNNMMVFLLSIPMTIMALCTTYLMANDIEGWGWMLFVLCICLITLMETVEKMKKRGNQ